MKRQLRIALVIVIAMGIGILFVIIRTSHNNDNVFKKQISKTSTEADKTVDKKTIKNPNKEETIEDSDNGNEKINFTDDNSKLKDAEDNKEIIFSGENPTQTDYVLPSDREKKQEKETNEEFPVPPDIEDIGEAYYKDFSEEDVYIDDEQGLYYVKNQLLVSGYIGMRDRDEFEALFAELGARIVGFIELTNDYQIEFYDDKTFCEMESIIQYLFSLPIVSNATYNAVSE